MTPLLSSILFVQIGFSNLRVSQRNISRFAWLLNPHVTIKLPESDGWLRPDNQRARDDLLPLWELVDSSATVSCRGSITRRDLSLNTPHRVFPKKSQSRDWHASFPSIFVIYVFFSRSQTIVVPSYAAVAKQLSTTVLNFAHVIFLVFPSRTSNWSLTILDSDEDAPVGISHNFMRLSSPVVAILLERNGSNSKSVIPQPFYGNSNITNCHANIHEV